jgi:hypothetical protein
MERLLLVIGVTALGAVTGCLALIFLTSLVVRPQSAESGGFAVLGWLLAGLFCGAPLGGIVGLVLGLRWLTQQADAAWGLAVWIGVACGVALGVVGTCSWYNPYSAHPWPVVVRWPSFWLFTGTITAALGTLGGVVARLGTALWRRATGSWRRPGPRRAGKRQPPGNALR